MAATTPARETQEAPGKDEDTGGRSQSGAQGPQEHPNCGILGQAGWGGGRQTVGPVVFQVAMVSGIDLSTEQKPLS